jgi:hypothetical protein
MTKESNGWDKTTAISSAALAVIAIATLWFAWKQIKEFRGEAQIQHLAEVVHEFDDGPIDKKLSSLAKIRVDADKDVLRPLDGNDAPGEMYDIANFFEYIGLLTKRGYLDKDDVWDNFSYYLFDFYADARPMIEAEQKKDADTFSDLTWLMDQMRTIEDQKHGGRQSHVDQDDIKDFYSGYLNTEETLPSRHPSRHKN